MPAEIVYNGRDPYSRKVVIDKGSQNGVQRGLAGGRRSRRDRPGDARARSLAEVTLLTDKDQAIPVQVVRNGLRAVAFGAGASGMLELRFMAANAEIQNGDRAGHLRASTAPTRRASRWPPSRASSATPPTRSRASSASPPRGVERGRYVLVLGERVRQAQPPSRRAGRRAATSARQQGSAQCARRKDADAA